jgi:hypothetical protein
VKLFKKAKSKFYWYDFTVRGQRYRGSTNEAKAARAAKVAGLKLAHVVENTDPLPQKAPVLLEFSRRFLEWLDKVRLEDKTKTYYRDGWRLLKTTTVVNMRLDQITRDVIETLRFSGASISQQWRSAFVKLVPRRGFRKRWSYIVGGTITARGS